MLRVYDDDQQHRQDHVGGHCERLQSMWVRRAVSLTASIRNDRNTLCWGSRGTQSKGSSPAHQKIHGSASHSPHAHQSPASYVLRRIQKPPCRHRGLADRAHPPAVADSWSGDGGTTTWGALTNDEQAEFPYMPIGNLTLLEAPLNQGAGKRKPHLKASRYYPLSSVRGGEGLGDEVELGLRRDHGTHTRAHRGVSAGYGLDQRYADGRAGRPGSVVDLAIPPARPIRTCLSTWGSSSGATSTTSRPFSRGSAVGFGTRRRSLPPTMRHLIHKTRIPRTKISQAP